LFVTSKRDPAKTEVAADDAAKINAHLARFGLLSAPQDLSMLDDMVLAPETRKSLSRVVLEQSRRDALLARGLRPARKLLFSGLPGTGKTMAAGAIARAIRLPMFRVELHGVFSQMFGQSAHRLAKVFEYVRTMPAVYLFDEFDSIGADRAAIGSESDGGEARRVVNALLQFIEGDQSDSLIVAATNHVQMLDSAIFRRFDEMIVFEPLTKDELVELVRRRLDGFDAEPLDYDAIYEVTQSLGHADLCAALDRARKDHVLEGAAISTQGIVDGIASRTCMRDAAVGGRH
jgi:SpoVK/Ycf46/Vps4 family AAA+-type ATPase